MNLTDPQQRFSAHLTLAHSLWKKHLLPDDCAIDATCGNGRDTQTLAEFLTGSGSRIVSIDIQKNALESAEKRLAGNLPQETLSKISFIHACHSTIDSIALPHPPRLVVYNLGYLPGGNKAITTETSSTLESLSKAASLLIEGGAISITCYSGHPEGKSEEDAILSWTSSLDPNQWYASQYRWINRPTSPTFLWLQKLSI